MALAHSAGFLQGTDRGRALAEEAMREMELTGDATAPTQRAGLLCTLGQICWWHGDPYATVARCREALRILPDELSPIAARACIILATPHLYWGELDTALDYAQKGLETATKLQLQELLPSAYSALGNVLTRRGQYTRAEEVLRQAIELSRRLGLESYVQVLASGDLAFNLCQQGRVDEARQMAEAALWAHTESADSYEVCVCRSVLADVWLDAGQLEPAERLFESMLELEERRQFRIPLAMVYFGLAYIYLQTGRRAAGMEMVKKSLDLIAPTNTYRLYLDQGQRALVVCRAAQGAGLHPSLWAACWRRWERLPRLPLGRLSRCVVWGRCAPFKTESRSHKINGSRPKRASFWRTLSPFAETVSRWIASSRRYGPMPALAGAKQLFTRRSIACAMH